MIDRQNLQKLGKLFMMFKSCSQLEHKMSNGSIGKSSRVLQRSCLADMIAHKPAKRTQNSLIWLCVTSNVLFFNN